MALNDDRGQRWAWVAMVGFHYQIWVVQTWGTRQDCNFHGDDGDDDDDGDHDPLESFSNLFRHTQQKLEMNRAKLDSPQNEMVVCSFEGCRGV